MEAYAGRAAMEMKARKEVAKGAKTELFKIMEEQGQGPAHQRHLGTGSKHGDELATRLIDRAVKALGAGVASASTCSTPRP